MTPEEAFPAYRPIVTDWGAFQRAMDSPQPDGIRTNRLKTTVDRLRNYLADRGFTVERSELFPTLLYWRTPDYPASATVPHWTGSYYIQDPVSLLPVQALRLEPGERVLDLCAAPGGKTLYMAEIVGDQGSVIANDPSFNRRVTLSSNVQRIGACNVAITGYDGQSVPESHRFGAILVDAPCTGEGSGRGTTQPPVRRRPDRYETLGRTQRQLLRKAYRLLEPGGRLVYSTCSYAPEENERVVADLLESSDARLEEIPIEGPHDPGVTRWKEWAFPEVVARMWRCYPHHYDGGGHVLARIARPATDTTEG